MKRKASAEWKGSLKEGKGSISTESGVLAKSQYSFGTRFESESAPVRKNWSPPRRPTMSTSTVKLRNN